MKLMRIVLLSLAPVAAGMLPVFASAHEGHDEPRAAVPASGGPQRLPDGSVFLPKPAQRRFGIRTVLAERQELPQSIELNGRVVMDPNAGGKVQATQSGRIEAGPKGLPTLGRAVARGEVLAYVRPLAASIERGNQQAQLAELRANRAVAEQKLARLQELEGSVPRKEIEQTRLELQALGERVAAVGLLDDLLADFPFEGDADRANVIGYMFTPLVRPALGCPTPLALIDANPLGLTASEMLAVVREHLRGAHLFLDVETGTEPLQHAAGAVPERTGARQMPAVLSVGAPQAGAHLRQAPVRFRETGLQALPLPPDGVQVLRQIRRAALG